MRYTEARLTAIAEELLRDIRHDTVDFRDNYDATLHEPIVLPAALPQLLVNGSTGIAVGMATNIPPHNLREVVEALVALVDDPSLQTKDLLKYIKGPDFPTGGEILNTKAELRQIYETGQGPVRVRSPVQAREDRPARRAWSSPRSPTRPTRRAWSRRSPSTSSAGSCRSPSTCATSRPTTCASSSSSSPRPSADAVMAYLFKHTSLQMNFNVNLTALVPTGRAGVGQPARLTLLELCRHFLDFRREVVRRRLTHELSELRERLHILEGFLKLFDGVDKAIKIIRGAESRPDAQRSLMKAFDLDELQADAILETRLYQLARLEIDKIREEQREKMARAKEIERLLKSDKALWNMVSSELRKVAADFGDARRTVLKAGAELTYDAEAYVVHEDATVVVTRDGWMKRVGEIKDPSSTRLREGDQAKWILRGNTRDSLALFSSVGIAYVMKVTNVPATTGYGEPVQSLLNFKDKERIVSAVLLRAAPAERDEAPAKVGQGELFSGEAAPPEASTVLFAGAEQAVPVDRWLVATAAGMGFFSRPDLSETTRSGRRFARTKDDDALVTVAPAAGDVITAVSEAGKVLSFPAEELPELAGAGRGVILMRLDTDERLVAAVCHPAKSPPTAIGDDGTERKITAARAAPTAPRRAARP